MNLNATITKGGMESAAYLVAAKFSPQKTAAKINEISVNTAARLQGVAPVNGVVVGEATFRSTRRLFDYQELGAVQVKGKGVLDTWFLVARDGQAG